MAVSELSFLVVEDHVFQRNMVARMLKGLKAAAVHTAGDGREALDILKGLPNAVDVIISDLDMPGMDGMEFIRHIGAQRYASSLIIASSLDRGVVSAVETMSSAYGIHFLGTIEKPVTAQKLIALVNLHRAATTVAAANVPGPTFELHDITRGLEADEFEPYFQPKVDIASLRVVGAEALARWRHPEHGVVAPFAFIKPLEDAGKIHILFRCMLAKAVRFCRTLEQARHDATVAVNLSTRSLADVGLAEDITALVVSGGVDPRCVILEITESAATSDLGKALENLARLRMKGFGLSIDDYGTGYSSMEQLTRIPFTELKIDRSFVTHAGRQESAKVILSSSLELARRLKIKAVAEGVETQADWDLLVELGCDIAQGYYIAKPMAAEAYLEWFRGWPRNERDRVPCPA
jgi:EAL domain-containing protein (putative c-di-GMP-specific phosphodiesterase class I)/CheY-like chemotaxis protein